jgi:hypothetical protein
MSANRVVTFMKRILQNSKLNREKFVKNKMYYNIRYKNRIINKMVVKRYITTSNRANDNNTNSGFGGGNNNRPPNFMVITMMAFGLYFTSGRFYEKK